MPGVSGRQKEKATNQYEYSSFNATLVIARIERRNNQRILVSSIIIASARGNPPPKRTKNAGSVRVVVRRWVVYCNGVPKNRVEKETR